jgi:hypothetical protein
LGRERIGRAVVVADPGHPPPVPELPASALTAAPLPAAVVEAAVRMAAAALRQRGALPEGLVMLGPETPAAVQQGQALRPTGHNSAAAAAAATFPETTPPMALLAVAGQDRDPLPTLVQVKPRLVLPQLNTCCRQEPPGRTALPGIHRRFNGLRWFPQGPALRTAAKGVAAA